MVNSGGKKEGGREGEKRVWILLPLVIFVSRPASAAWNFLDEGHREKNVIRRVHESNYKVNQEGVREFPPDTCGT